MPNIVEPIILSRNFSKNFYDFIKNFPCANLGEPTRGQTRSTPKFFLVRPLLEKLKNFRSLFKYYNTYYAIS